MESANPKASIGTLKLDSFNPSIMEEAVQGAAIDHIQLARGRFQARLLSAKLGEERLDCGSYNLPLHARGPMPETHLTLGFVMNGSGTAYLNGGAIQRTATVVLSEGTELDYLMAPGSEWLAFQIKRETLEQLGIDSLDRFNGTFDIGSEDEQQLLTYLRVLVSALEEITTDNPTIADHDGFCAKVFTGMLDAFGAALENIYSRSRFLPLRPGNRYQLVKRAVEYIDAYYGGTIHIGAICPELGTTQKTLERAFLNHYGVTPKRYLDFVRLAKARRLLLQAHQAPRPIADIASECGINHLGRFASLYRTTYGELPSQTTGSPAPRSNDIRPLRYRI
jgi:AraC family ethanolamine operon transcriptional activator